VAHRNLEEILAWFCRYLQRLGHIDPDWEWSCSFGRGVIAVLQPYCHVLQEKRHQARQTSLLCYFEKKREEPVTDPKMTENDPVDPDYLQPGHFSR
jgi:hypothetical protein